MYDPSGSTATEPLVGWVDESTVREPASLSSTPFTTSAVSTGVVPESSAAVGVTVIVTVRVTGLTPSVTV